jgi:ferredoxin
MVSEGAITPMLESTVKEIGENDVILVTREGEKTIANHVVYALIGSEIPIRFFERSRIRMEGEKHLSDHVKLAALLFFAAVIYFGKSAPITEIASVGDFFTLPSQFLAMSWPKMLKGFFAWFAFLGMVATGIALLFHMLGNAKTLFTGSWRNFKYGYFTVMFVLFAYLYLTQNLGGQKLLGWSTGTWYAAMYTLTILVFGLRRMHIKPTGYVKGQTWTLIAVQAVFLFLLPVFVFPALGEHGLLSDWVMENVFPGGSYWRSFGLVLAWPLFLYNLASGQPVLFWLVLSVVQSFVILPYLVYRWGKGSFCGWICSCGGLAETLGDEYRTKAPHGPTAKKVENAGQIVLWFAAVASAFVVLRTWADISLPGTDLMQNIYAFVVDIVLAGVLGVGVYFFYSGRVWCRFFCPLAALLHLYTRFSIYRIFSDKKRCISCGICTRVCHMGIDVMGYASRGIPMDDVECVRCSSCITSCPMDVLTFGNQTKADPDNLEYKKGPISLMPGWGSGLPAERYEKLVASKNP